METSSPRPDPAAPRALWIVRRFWPIATVLALHANPATAQRHDDEVRRLIVEDSIARWNGECPCPYSYAWNGRQCANNSAYIKRLPGAPYCYAQDVPPHEIYRYRRER